MAGAAANSAQSLLVAKPPRKPKHRLTYDALVAYDDLLTEVLVDKVFYCTEIRKNHPDFKPNPLAQTENVEHLIRNFIVPWTNYTDVERRMLELPAIFNFYRTLETPRQKDDFRAHLEKYANVYRTDCPYEIDTTNRFTISRQEASIVARKNIRAGTTIKYLQGIQVILTPEESVYIKQINRDFSVVVSSRTSLPSIFLGPARFCNHDCNSNALLNPFGSDGMEVRATRDIPAGEEITVNYAENYFEEDNSKCLCETCEQKFDKGWSQYDENGERILPAAVEEVEDLDQNGNPRRTLRERNIDKDYKERPPTPSPPRGRKSKRASSPPPVPIVLQQHLSEEFVKDEDVVLSDVPLEVRNPTPPPQPMPLPPPPPPPPKRRVPRKQPTRDLNPLYRCYISVFPDMRERWIVDEGSTDASSSDGGAEEVTDASPPSPSSTIRAVAAGPASKKEEIEPTMIVGYSEVSSLTNGTLTPLVATPKSTPATSVDAFEQKEDLVGSPTTPKQQPARRLANEMMKTSSGRSRHLSSAPFGSGRAAVAPMQMPMPEPKIDEKRKAAQMSSSTKSGRIKDAQSGSECDMPIGDLMERGQPLGDNSETPMEIDLGIDSDTPLARPLQTANKKVKTEDKDEVGVLLSRRLGAQAEASTDTGVKEVPERRRPGRPARASQAVAASNFYGPGSPTARMTILDTPENSPAKIIVKSDLIRRLQSRRPQISSGPLDLNPPSVPAAALNVLEVVHEWDEGEDADSESGNEESSPSRQHKRVKGAQRTIPRKRVPGDYLLAPELLLTPKSIWVDCRLCLEFFVQADQDQERTHCPRCVRHAKLYGTCWPDTDPKDGEERSKNWLAVLMQGKWKGIESELKRVSRRRRAIERCREKKKALEDGRPFIEGCNVKKVVDQEVGDKEHKNQTEEEEEDKMSIDNDNSERLQQNGELGPSVEGKERRIADDEDLDVLMGDYDAEAPPPGASPNQIRSKREKTVECPLCKEMTSWKGTRRQLFRGGYRHICPNCHVHEERRAAAGKRARQAKKFKDTVDDDDHVPLGSSKAKVAPQVPAKAHRNNNALQNTPASKVPIVRTTDDIPPSAFSPPLSMDEARRRILRCRWQAHVSPTIPCTCGLLSMTRTKEAEADRCNLTHLGVAILNDALHDPLAMRQAVQLLHGVDADQARGIVKRVLKAKGDHSLFNACFHEDGLQHAQLSFGVRLAACKRTRENENTCDCGLWARIQEEETSLRYNLGVLGRWALASALHSHQNYAEARELMQTRDLCEVKEIIASVLRGVSKDEQTYEKYYRGAHPPYNVLPKTLDTPIDADANSGMPMGHDTLEVPLPKSLQRKIQACNWMNQFSCACGLHGRVLQEVGRLRCNISHLGMNTLKKALHDPTYCSQAVGLITTADLEEVKKIIASVFRSVSKDDKMYDLCYGGPHLPYTFELDGIDTPINVGAGSAAPMKHNSPNLPLPRSHEEAIKGCRFTITSSCTCGLLGRMLRGSKNNLSRVGMDTLKKTLHSPTYLTQAVEFMENKDVAKTIGLVASVLRAVCQGEGSFGRCYTGLQRPFYASPDATRMPRMGSTPMDIDDDAVINPSAASTSRNRSPVNGIRPRDNRVVDATELDDTSSTSDLEFVSSTRIDGTPANPQAIMSPDMRPKSRRDVELNSLDLESDEGIDLARTRSTFTGLNSKPSSSKRKSRGGIGMGSNGTSLDREKPSGQKRQRSLRDYLPRLSGGTPLNNTPITAKGKGEGTQFEPMVLDDTSSSSDSPTGTTDDFGRPKPSLLSATRRNAMPGSDDDLDGFLRSDGTRKSAREVYGRIPTGKENQVSPLKKPRV